MASVNETLVDQAVDHVIDLNRFSNGAVRRIVSLLNRTDDELRTAIIEALLRLPADSFTVQRLETLLGSVRSLNASAMRAVEAALEGEMRDLADFEAAFQVNSLQASFPKEARALVQFQRVTPEQAYAAAMARPFQGGLLRDWTKSLEDSRAAKVREAIRQGYVQGQTTDQIVRKIAGTKAKGYRDGMIDRSRREVESVVRTALSHTAEVAREKTIEANADLIKAERWLSTLDTRTSPMCRVRDQKLYTPGDHKPIDHKIPWLQGPGRLHFCCRSTSVPVTKSWEELGLSLEELSPTTRASMDGQVSAETTYSKWLQRQPRARQEEILGPTRAALIRDGKLPADELYNDRGAYLTIEQLRAKYAAQFAKAGL